jgi:hypothetical protein
MNGSIYKQTRCSCSQSFNLFIEDRNPSSKTHSSNVSASVSTVQYLFSWFFVGSIKPQKFSAQRKVEITREVISKYQNHESKCAQSEVFDSKAK